MKFKNKGLLYLLNLYDKDVTKMLQYYNTEQQKVRQERINQRKIESEAKRENNVYYAQNSFDTPNPRELDQIGMHLPKNRVPETVKQLQKKKTGKKTIFNESTETLDLFDEPIGLNDFSRKPTRVKATKRSMDVSKSFNTRNNSIVIAAEADHSTFAAKKRTLGDPVPVKALEQSAPGPAGLKLFDMLSCHESELEKYMVWLKQHMKLYKAMFHKYATVSANKMSVKKLTFDDMKDQKNTMSLSEVFAFMNDFNMSKNYTIKRDDIKKVIKLINLKGDTAVKTSAELDLYGFIEFVL